MGSSLTLGRIAGIRVGVHWSWLVVFALIVWTLASGVFPETNPDLGDGARIVAAVIASVLFFVSVLLHELDEVPILREDDDAIDALERVSGSEINRALVLDGDRLVGLLSITDLARALEAAPRRPSPASTDTATRVAP